MANMLYRRLRDLISIVLQGFGAEEGGNRAVCCSTYILSWKILSPMETVAPNMKEETAIEAKGYSLVFFFS